MADLDNLTSNVPKHLDDLLKLHDEEFLRVAYRAILGREIDRSGAESYLRRLRSGDDRFEILASLRYSREGRRVSSQLPGLKKALRFHRWSANPGVRKVLRKIGLAGRISKRQRRMNMLENEVGRLGLNPGAVSLPPAIDMTPSRKIVGNVATAARAWNQRPAIDRILVLKLDHYGDFFVATRAFATLRNAWPDAHITLVCGSWNVKFANTLGLFDDVLAFDFSLMTPTRPYGGKVSWVGRCEPITSLPLTQYDLAIDLRHDMDTRPCLLFVDAAYKAGYDDPWQPWPNGGRSPLNIGLSQTVMHAELRCTILAQLAVTTLQPPHDHPISRLLPDTPATLPFEPKRYLVVSMGASARNREWGTENFTLLLQRIIREFGLSVVFVGAKADRAANEMVAVQLPAESHADVSGTPFEDAPWLMNNAAAFIGCDSGPGHLSSLLGIPTVTVYAGVSEPQIWQPLGPNVAIVHSQTPCSYCHNTSCAFEFRCMQEIKPGDVFEQFSKLYLRSQAEKPTGAKSGTLA